MKLKIGVVGAGQFSQCFIPLFQAHPMVGEVSLAELLPERREKFGKAFGMTRMFTTYEDMLKSDVDAVAIFTQRHLHGPQTIQALQAGKHVYCAVPMAQSLEEISRILEEVKRSGLIYMTGETSYYYPSTVYCRDQFQAGAFGEFVYGEAQYIHDMSHGFYDAFKYSGGKDWKKVAGIPPMYYPTHSVSMILSVTGAKATKVACLGYEDRNEDGIFRVGGNHWDNPFSNETAIVRTSDGGMARFNEFRRVGWGGANSVYMNMFGLEAAYEENALGSVWSTIKGEVMNITDELSCESDYVNIDNEEGLHKALQRDFNSLLAKVHHKDRLPVEFNDKPNGHLGSHQFLVDDYVRSIATNKLPPNHAWRAADYLAPGLIAHESSKRGGEFLEVPDFGQPPAGWDILKV
ncbi:Gfo/Idh/MocA family protein [Paenibacillus sp. GCM10023252]|uniref:Gfo/Idh/MocA family protein n=1 Tax=Paenibacillus sp. GCM10023252 TaxID=3252649 RepID=UPI00360F4953